jgi:hypothetical protein
MSYDLYVEADYFEIEGPTVVFYVGSKKVAAFKEWVSVDTIKDQPVE